MKFITKPFKGSFGYEVQIGPIVIQYAHKEIEHKHKNTFYLGRLCIWFDSMWLD